MSIEFKQKPADPFAQLLETATMEEVMTLVAKEEGYTKKQLESSRTKLELNLVLTVHNLRGLSKERIEAMDLPPLVTEYLLRVKG